MRCHPQVERRIVDGDEHIGAQPVEQTPGYVQIAGHVGQVAHHLSEAHISHVAIVYDRSDARSSGHQIAAEKAETGFWITGFECLDQFRGMKIAGCLAGTEHVKQVSGLGFIVDSLGFMRRG